MGWGRSRSKNRGGWGFGGWAPYVPVAQRREQTAKRVAAMVKKGEKVSPVVIHGRAIATTFWGKAWCDNLESYMDYENRLPRGRTYVRNGSVVDLKIAPGKVKALVSGSSLYTVEITVKPLDDTRWRGVIDGCAGKIDSLVELLQGKLSKGVMETVVSRDKGLFPDRPQISLKCSCPDTAVMCKHVAAALYGVGSRLDSEPDLLFLLRQVDHMELIAKASTPAAIGKKSDAKGKILEVETKNLGSMFGIEIATEQPTPPRHITAASKAKVQKKTKKALARKAAPVNAKKKADRGGNAKKKAAKPPPPKRSARKAAK